MSKWQMVKLGEVCDVRDGTHDSPKYHETGYPLITSKNIIDGTIDFVSVNLINKDDFDKINKRSKVDSGDILMPMIGTIGNSIIVESNCEFAIKNVALIKFNNTTIHNKFVNYILKSTMFEKYVAQENRGGTQKFLSLGNIRSLKIPLPPLEEQQKIAKNLDLASELVKLYKTKLQELDKLIQSVFYDMFGDPVTNEKDWEVRGIHQIYDIIDGDRGVNYPKQEEFSKEGYCLFLNTGNVTKNGFSFDDTSFITKEKDGKLRKGKLQRNDIILTTRGTVGNLAYYTNDIPFENIRINSGMVILRRLSDINDIYFINYFRNPLVYRKLMSGSAQPQLPITNMKKANIMIPPLPPQQKFADIVTKIEEQKTEVNKALTNAEMLYNSLMQEYFE